MSYMFTVPPRLRLSPFVNVGLWVTFLVAVAGCPLGPDGPSDNGDGNVNTNGAGSLASVEAEFLRTNQQVSVSEPPLSIVYSLLNVPDDTTVSAFFTAATGDGDGELTIIATNLLPGTGQAFNFDPAVSGAGDFRLGFLLTLGADVRTILSDGVIEVQGAPEPRFILPDQAITEVEQGEEVFVSFDAGDPEGDVRWRLFYLSPTDFLTEPADELGTQLAVGSGNPGSFTLETDDLEPGAYRLGLSATDSGESIADTVSEGKEGLIVTIPNAVTSTPIIQVFATTVPSPPEFSFTSPGVVDVELFGDEAFTIRFAATADASAGVATIEVFLDRDMNLNNGVFRTLEPNLPITATTVALPTDLDAQTYFVGATVWQGTFDPVTVYAGGSITVIRTPSLEVTAPNTSLPVAPLTPVEVLWTTNVPPSAGTIDVFARALDPNRFPTGPEIEVLPLSPTTVTSAEFTSAESGLFEISVRLTLSDTTIDTSSCQSGICIETAPKPIRFSTVPPILWLGSLAGSDSPFAGAILEGVNFEDNAGASLAHVGDLDGDGFDEFVVGARYGKPFFINPSGVGPGEAYVIYGGSGLSKPLGVKNLNSVGTSLLRGVLLTGIRTVGDSDDTDGLSDVTLIPDADGDGVGEMVFGFPRTNSAGGTVGPLEAAGQFLNGGVVILSSNNDLLQDPPTSQRVAIDLGACGQWFSDLTVDPAITAEDQRAYDPDSGSCIEGTDGVADTIVGPSVGFIPLLATPPLEDFLFIPPGTPEGEGICVTETAVSPSCIDGLGQVVLGGAVAGSGFYSAEATPQQPRGARIIGPSDGSAFGTSVTWSNALDDASPGDLIISAPNRSASRILVDGIDSDITGSGIAFLSPNRNLWGADPSFPGTPPTPYQYLMGFSGHCGDGRAASFDPLRIAGDSGDHIQNILGIDDFNADGRNDFAVGAPTADSGRGRVYVAFRRDEAVEGDFVLNKLELAPTDPERLTGVLIVSNSPDGLGASLTTGVDLNGDNTSDLVIGSPDASGGIGEVIVVFGDPSLQSPAGGTSVAELLATRTASGRPRAARIKGNPLDATGQFGFNVANGGDIDGDGLDDLLIAAPNATPRFDPEPTDGVDALTEPGIDVDFDGCPDDVSGPLGLPNGNDPCTEPDSFDRLSNAGIVYVVYGSNRLDEIQTCEDSGTVCTTDEDCPPGERCGGTDFTINISQLGSNQLRGFMIVGRQAGDRIGGGDAGVSAQGGLSVKANRGRSYGLSTAGDVDGDGHADILVGSVLADPRRDSNTGEGVQNGGEAYLIYGSLTDPSSP